MKFTRCEKCKTRYNPNTVKKCPVCREIESKMHLYNLSFSEALRDYNKRYKRR